MLALFTRPVAVLWPYFKTPSAFQIYYNDIHTNIIAKKDTGILGSSL